MKRKVKNPLIRRIPKEFLSDWRKYLLVSLFLILTIGFVSGMHVANGSMMSAANEGITQYKLEDGHFELEEKADADLILAIENGEKAELRQTYLDRAEKELNKRFEEEFPPKFKEEFDAEFASQFEIQFCLQLLSSLLNQGLSEESARGMLSEMLV